MQFGDLALDEKRDLLRVQAAGQVVQGHFNDILADFFRIVGIIGQRLDVGDEHEHPVIVSLVLKENPIPERAHIVAQVKFAGRTVAGEDDSSHLFPN